MSTDPDFDKFVNFEIVNEGLANSPEVTAGDQISVHYTGKLDNGKVFDSNMDLDKNRKKGAPLKFKVGVGKVIRGWDEALLTMSVGESAELVIQPEWAYGKKGVEGKVPAGASLIFQVELVGIC